MDKIPQNIKVVINSVYPLVAALLLFIFAGRFAINKISEIRGNLQTSQTNIDVLTSKLTVLQSSNLSQAQTNAASFALPDRNSSIAVFSQLKILASSGGVLLSNIKGGAEIKDPNGLSRVDITFDATGARSQILAFADSITKIAPITLLDKIKINETAGGSRASIVVKSYWSEFPKSLSPITDRVDVLTTQEKDLLFEVSKLQKPMFVELSPSQGSGKAEPFN